MFTAFAKAAAQSFDPAFRRVLLLSVVLSLAVMAALGIAVWVIFDRTTFFDIGLFETVVDILGGLAIWLVTWLLFPLVIPLAASLFLEDIIRAVEERHYGDLPQPAALTLLQGAWAGISIFVIGLLLNIIALPAYVLLWFLGVGIVLYYGINGYLLGREYFEMVALRRLDRRAVRALRKANRGRVLGGGVVIAFLMTVPIVNLFAPIIAAAAMVHIVERARRGEVAP